jgi:hypothetical protein
MDRVRYFFIEFFSRIAGFFIAVKDLFVGAVDGARFFLWSLSDRTKRVIAASVAGIVMLSLTLFVSLNADLFRLAGIEYYTKADVVAMYQRGYDDYVGDLEYYMELSDNLRLQLAEKEADWQERYDNTVGYYEGRILRLERQIEVLIDYIEVLESYLVELNFDFADSSNGLALLNIQLGAYRAMYGNYSDDIGIASARLVEIDGALAGLNGSKGNCLNILADLNEVKGYCIARIEYYDGLIAGLSNGISFSFVSGVQTGRLFGATVEAGESNFAYSELTRIFVAQGFWTFSAGKPSASVGFFSLLNVVDFRYPDGGVVVEGYSGSALRDYILNVADYYYYCYNLYQDYTVNLSIYQSERAEYVSALTDVNAAIDLQLGLLDEIEAEISALTLERGEKLYIIADAGAKLLTVSGRIDGILERIEELSGV